MNNETQKQLNNEQAALVAELVMTYGIEADDVIFFESDPKPFLMYEANCVLANHLANISCIDAEPVPSVSDDAVTVRCTLTLSDGRVRSACGVANTAEQIRGKESSSQQLYYLAVSRAMRSALRSAGIDLIKRHFDVKNGEDVLDFKPKSNINALLGQAHKLGAEIGFITGSDKSAWRAVLRNRYGVETSGELSEKGLADFVAFLRSLVPSNLPVVALANKPTLGPFA